MNKAAPAEFAIDIRNLGKTYRNGKQVKKALSAVNLQIPRGSFYGLLGPNGAGKSTLINILAGLVDKSTGDVSIAGHDIITATKLAKRKIGIVPQEISFEPTFTVTEVLENHAGLYGVPKSQRITQQLLNALGLVDKAHVVSRSLSGGMKRRLLIAKALVHKPDIVVLDEPTAGVDVQLRQQLWEYVVQLNKNGTTVILTTHYLEEAQELCDYIAIINHGRIVIANRKQALLQQVFNKKFKFSFSMPLKVIPAELADLQPELCDGCLCFTQPHEHSSFINEVMQKILNSGLEVRDIMTIQPNVEDAFKYFINNYHEAAAE